ncbi:hypothetical protein PR048_004415 [Dryococelus australis]|uniref:Uncharacterized protein n=1 Tax=Dryococelus australis TaxID=614101 RepID=A0ABQ9I5F0_9NEOP|nr:hypothetical protein PR048_004415 [Dryococelus australis]
MIQQLIKAYPRESIAAFHPSGWIQTSIFTYWFQIFCKRNETIRIDEHSSHQRSIDVLNIARENSVNILCLSTPSTHKLQLLDKIGEVAVSGFRATGTCPIDQKWFSRSRLFTFYF